MINYQNLSSLNKLDCEYHLGKGTCLGKKKMSIKSTLSNSENLNAENFPRVQPLPAK